MEQEKINELNQEEAQEAKEEPMREWINDSQSYLLAEFVEKNSDLYDEFCQERYHQLED